MRSLATDNRHIRFWHKIMTMMMANLSYYWKRTILLLVCYLVAAVAAADNVVRSANDLLYDENNKLSSHYLLYYSSSSSDKNAKKCPLDDFTAPTGFEARPVEGYALQALFGTTTTTNNNNSKSKCQAACIERGVDRSLAFAPMPHKFFHAGDDDNNNNNNNGDFNTWFVDHCRKVEVCVMSYHSKDHPLNLYWRQPESGEWKLHLQIEYGCVL